MRKFIGVAAGFLIVVGAVAPASPAVAASWDWPDAQVTAGSWDWPDAQVTAGSWDWPDGATV